MGVYHAPAWVPDGCLRRKPTILTVEAGHGSRDLLRRSFSSTPDIIEVHTAANALGLLRAESPDLVLLRSDQGGTRTALRMAGEIRRTDRGVPIIFIAADSSEELAIAAIRVGVTDYLKEPVQPDELIASIVRALSAGASCHRAPVSESAGLVGEDRMVGRSRPISVVRTQIRNLAAVDCNVLITGATGTGKQLVAELLHLNSPRRAHPFLSINCAAVPDSLVESEFFGYERGAFTSADERREGLLKRADKGAVLLDEIGDMSPFAQAKILNAIETKVIRHVGGDVNVALDIRVLTATNQDLESLVVAGKFRRDLYHRIAVACIHVPALHERREDIPLLCQHYVSKMNRRFGCDVQGFAEELIELLLRYTWPGNVRELGNLVEAVFANMGPDRPNRTIGLADLPAGFRQGIEDVEGLPRDEKGRLLSALLSTNWNKTKAAQKLHWSRMTLYRKMTKYHLEEEHGHA